MLIKITAGKYTYKDFSFLFLAAFLFFSCHEKKARIVEPSFYYWKSVFRLDGTAQQTMDSLQVKNLYTKFFDVDWDGVSNVPAPVAKLQSTNFRLHQGVAVIPVVFITNECIQKIDTAQIAGLAVNIHTLINEISKSNKFNIIDELQIDCDWTASTKSSYFQLLRLIREQDPGLQLSATIRLHQIKYLSKSGIPPVDKGMLMCYNMGNLKNPATKNSIIETEELKKYTGSLSQYPLPLDIALPLFSWNVLFRKNVYSGLIENIPATVFTNTFTLKKDNRIELLQDTLLQGYNLKKGDILRTEESNYSEIIAVAESVNARLKNTRVRVALFHMDAVILNKYSFHELEAIYNSMR